MEQRRRGLVLGAGGVLGAAWTIGAMAALEEAEGFEVGSCEHIVGTSAGSVLAALVGAGVKAADLLDDQRGRAVRQGPLAGYTYDHDRATGGALPSVPRPRMGSTKLLMRAVRHPRSVTPLAAASSLLPTGRGSLWTVRHLVDAINPIGQWSPHPGVWVVAMDYDSGRRVAFGKPGEPEAELAEAVLASCSIPAWYAPVTIGGRRYIDGGTCSPTSLDLLADLGLDEVFVLAPMCSFDYDEPTSVGARVERSFRRTVTRRMVREAGKVRSGGTQVTLLGPGREDLEAIGANLMDPSRRQAVIETSLRTSAEALQRARDDEMSWDGLMRVYAPATRADLDRLQSDGSWRPAAAAFAVTPALRGWVSADGPVDDEQLELAALSEAARHALALLGPGRDPEHARRVVVALDLPTAQVEVDDDGPDDPPGQVRLLVDVVPVGRVAAVHMDERSAAGAVVAAAAALDAAEAGDTVAEAVVSALDDHELLWYDAAELPGLTEPTESTESTGDASRPEHGRVLDDRLALWVKARHADLTTVSHTVWGCSTQ